MTARMAKMASTAVLEGQTDAMSPLAWGELWHASAFDPCNRFCRFNAAGMTNGNL